MSYNFGNDGATQFQGGGYGYATRMFTFCSRLFSLDDNIPCASCLVSDFGEKERFWGKENFENLFSSLFV